MAYINGKETFFSPQVNVAGGVEIVPTLEGDEADKAPSVQAVNVGLGGKVDRVKNIQTNFHRVYIESAGNNGVALKTLSSVPKVDGGSGCVVTYAPNSGGGVPFNDNYVLITSDPKSDYHCAHKKYVDDEIEKSAEALRAELGTTIQTVEVSGDKYEGWAVPNGALPYFHVETTEFTYDDVNGGVSTANFTTLTFYDASGIWISSILVNGGEDYAMPNGTAQIKHNAVDLNDSGELDPAHNIEVGTMYMPKLIFQVEV